MSSFTAWSRWSLSSSCCLRSMAARRKRGRVMSRGLRVLGHPLHAVLSDFPLALLGTSLLWDAVGLWRGEAIWWAIAFWNIALGLIVALAAATAGAVDYAAIE